MTVDTIVNSNALIAQYIPDDRPEYAEERTRHQNAVQESLVNQQRTDDPARRQAERAKAEDAVVTLTQRSVQQPPRTGSSETGRYFSTRAYMYLPGDQFMKQVQTAYTILDQKNFRGIYVDRLI